MLGAHFVGRVKVGFCCILEMCYLNAKVVFYLTCVEAMGSVGQLCWSTTLGCGCPIVTVPSNAGM